MTVIKSLEHHALFLLLLQLATLLLFSRVLGEIARKLRQPQVIGELLAGVLLGPSVLGLVWPSLHDAIFPPVQAQHDLLAAVAWLGVLVLLIVTGLETDLDLIVRRGRIAICISYIGIFVPLSCGFMLGQGIPDRYLADPNKRLVFCLFMAVAMSISAVPVLAKVLLDLKIIRRDIGQISLAAGMSDDLNGWILLSVVAGLATSGQLDAATAVRTLVSALLFIAFCFTLGRPLMHNILTWVDEQVPGTASQISTVLVIALFAAAFTQYLHIEAVLGAFMMGILAGQSRRLHIKTGHTLELFAGSFISPIFFASAGLKVDMEKLLDPVVIGLGLVVLLIACVGKYLGVYLGGWLGGLSHWERLAVGSGMNARGALEIIVATVGLSLGVLGPEMYAIIVMVAIVTSMMAPPLLRLTLARVEIGKEERERLEGEQLAEESFVKKLRRVLLPSRGGHNAEVAARLIQALQLGQPLDVTLLYVKGTDDTNPDKAMEPIKTLFKSPRVKVSHGRGDIAERITHEAARGYDMMVLGASEGQYDSASMFNNIVDKLIRESPCYSLVVRSGPQSEDFAAPTKILVPTVGTQYSSHALELAAAMARTTGALVTLVHVVMPPDIEHDMMPRVLDKMNAIASDLVDHQADLGRRLGAEVDTRVLEGSQPEQVILKLAREEAYGLIVMGSNLRPVSTRAFFGHRVEHILRNAPCAVAVISS